MWFSRECIWFTTIYSSDLIRLWAQAKEHFRKFVDSANNVPAGGAVRWRLSLSPSRSSTHLLTDEGIYEDGTCYFNQPNLTRPWNDAVIIHITFTQSLFIFLQTCLTCSRCHILKMYTWNMTVQKVFDVHNMATRCWLLAYKAKFQKKETGLAFFLMKFKIVSYCYLNIL